jgi:hypothetical protein
MQNIVNIVENWSKININFYQKFDKNYFKSIVYNSHEYFLT